MARITLALFVVLFALTWWRYSPPSPAPMDAPAERFSAARARVVQEKLVGDGQTRFVGTEGNRKGREAMIAELGKVGWAVETQADTSCTHHGVCVPVVNVVAKLDGAEPALPGVLITAHYDSVGAGPGASDDGLGVATIVETARALTAGKKPKRTIVAVLTDAEEAGLGEVLLQPMSICYTAQHGMAMTMRKRPIVAWYGDLDFFPHFTSFIRNGVVDVSVSFGTPVAVDAGHTRKEVAKALEPAVRHRTDAASRLALPVTS